VKVAGAPVVGSLFSTGPIQPFWIGDPPCAPVSCALTTGMTVTSIEVMNRAITIALMIFCFFIEFCREFIIFFKFFYSPLILLSEVKTKLIRPRSLAQLASRWLNHLINLMPNLNYQMKRWIMQIT
jgi:hypothetical protein